VRSHRWLPIVCAFVVAACQAPTTEYLDIATTTSVQNSGLLDAILPHFQPATVRVHAVGSGLALKMLADSKVDLVISHAPEAEKRYVGLHRDWVYRKIAFSHFLLVGPRSDPARVGQASDVLDAMRRIVASGASFVSRGDGSGTDEREQSLWQQAGVSLPLARRFISGASMAVTLRQADERQAYTLSDDATFWQLEHRLNATALFTADPRLVNSYAVLFPSKKALAGRFADWLHRGDGRDRIAAFRVQGRVAFVVWPAGCPSADPQAQPCELSPERR
jgi:tungstate transport system substrate-binding protein